MLPIRYVVLVALVVWLGGMVAVLFGDWLRPLSLLTAACGGIILVGLFVMKFVGPPPRAFMLRVTIAAIMLAIAVYTGVRMPRSAGGLITINVALGAILLYWYVRES